MRIISQNAQYVGANKKDKFQEYVDAHCWHLSWGDKAGCACELLKGHKDLHICAAPTCDETWEEHDAQSCSTNSRECPYQHGE